MRFFILGCCTVFMLAGCSQQTGKAPLTSEQVARAGSDRQADINRAVDLMSSPDPRVRLAGVQQAISNGDRNLRQLALSMAFASSDPTLRGAALVGAIATANSLPIRFAGYYTKNHYISDKLGESFYVYIYQFNNSTDEFTTRTEYSPWKTDSNGERINIVKPGLVTGNSVKFGIDLSEVGNSDCLATLALDPAGSTMHGTLMCKNNEAYAIASSAIN